MYKIYKGMKIKDGEREREFGLILFDPEKKEYLFRSKFDGWRVGEENLEILDEGKVISNPILKKQLVIQLKQEILLSQKTKELETLRREYRKTSDFTEELYGNAFPTAKHIMNTLEYGLPRGIRFTSYTVSPDYEQSFTLAHENDLGTHRTDLLDCGYGNREDYLKVTEQSLFASCGPKLVTIPKNQFKTLVVEKAEHGWQSGDKESISVFAYYHVKIKKLTNKNLAAVMEEIKTLASMI